jgi:hypothetical protein
MARPSDLRCTCSVPVGTLCNQPATQEDMLCDRCRTDHADPLPSASSQEVTDA